MCRMCLPDDGCACRQCQTPAYRAQARSWDSLDMPPHAPVPELQHSPQVLHFTFTVLIVIGMACSGEPNILPLDTPSRHAVPGAQKQVSICLQHFRVSSSAHPGTHRVSLTTHAAPAMSWLHGGRTSKPSHTAKHAEAHRPPQQRNQAHLGSLQPGPAGRTAAGTVHSPAGRGARQDVPQGPACTAVPPAWAAPDPAWPLPTAPWRARCLGPAQVPARAPAWQWRR